MYSLIVDIGKYTQNKIRALTNKDDRDKSDQDYVIVYNVYEAFVEFNFWTFVVNTVSSNTLLFGDFFQTTSLCKTIAIDADFGIASAATAAALATATAVALATAAFAAASVTAHKKGTVKLTGSYCIRVDIISLEICFVVIDRVVSSVTDPLLLYIQSKLVCVVTMPIY